MQRICVNDVNGFIRHSILRYSVTDNAYGMKHKKSVAMHIYAPANMWQHIKERANYYLS